MGASVSAGAGVLSRAVESTNRTEVTSARTRSGLNLKVAAPPGIISLARQAFFPSEAPARQRVLFVSADEETNVTGVAEQVAHALAGMQKTVSLVERRIETDALPAKKSPMAVRNVEYWAGFQVAENFWRIPSSILGGSASARNGNAFGALPFECVVLASSIRDAIAPLFLEIADGAVLTITAHKTRREAALRAKQVLEQFKVKLIGTVLDGRTFPIPESIYRRL